VLAGRDEAPLTSAIRDSQWPGQISVDSAR